MQANGRLILSCPDRTGIIAAVTGFLHEHDVNVTRLDEHATRATGGSLFMRLELQTPRADVPQPTLGEAFGEAIAPRFDMKWRISWADERKRTVILVSGWDHALLELLWRWRRGELPTEIPMVIANHDDLRSAVEGLDVPFHHVPFDNERSAEAETAMLELIGDADLVVLARYMRILSNDFVKRYRNRIINIHHSFLPAFAGARPYRQAWDRGVKIIGATAHYATAELDAGPIIEQDVARCGHRDTVAELEARGRDLERTVLSRAVRWHLEDRILVHGNKTVVFS